VLYISDGTQVKEEREEAKRMVVMSKEEEGNFASSVTGLSE
jgi:hypothetical protein